MSNYMVSRREGYNIRMEMLADRLLALPTELLKMIYENVRLDHAATRIQAMWRRYTASILNNARSRRFALRFSAFPAFSSSGPRSNANEGILNWSAIFDG